MPSSILIVENSSELARQVVYNLQQNGYNVFHANQGMKSLELHEAYCPDLVILDWTLPGLNGEEVLTWLRQLCAPRVLMLTEHGSPGGLAGQADATLDKPFTLDHLLQKVGEMLARPGGLRAENLLICGPLELEPGAYRAVLHGQPLNLAVAERLRQNARGDQPVRQRVARAGGNLRPVGDDPPAAIRRARKIGSVEMQESVA